MAHVKKRRGNSFLQRNKKAALMAFSLILCVVTLSFAPGIRFVLLSYVNPSLGLFDTEKAIVQSGSFVFTLGDLAFIISLIAASFTISFVRKS